MCFVKSVHFNLMKLLKKNAFLDKYIFLNEQINILA